MTNKEIKVQKALGTYLSLKWKERNKLRKEADKLEIERNKLQAEERKLRTKGRKLRIKAYKLYTDAVKEVYGPGAIINWNNGDVTNVEKTNN